MQQVIQQLLAAGIGGAVPNAPLAEHTTWKIGGPADLLVVPDGTAQLAKTLHILRENELTFLTIGKGSNMLVSDKGVRGVVIKLGKGMGEFRFDGSVVIAGGAVGLIPLSVRSAKAGLTGLEFASGIPGTVGGAVFMNAGAHGSDMSRILKEAEIVLETGDIIRMDNEQLTFAYRHSWLHGRSAIVTEAVLDLAFGDKEQINATMAAYKERRLRTQPLSMACAGSTFRNPPGDYAARLIEEAGLKGFRIGGAEVSRQHANFIINTGGATAEDVLQLMDHMRRTVEDKNGISLVPEVLIAGETT